MDFLYTLLQNKYFSSDYVPTLNECFSAQGIIQELDLTIHADSRRGGYDVYIELIQEEKTCKTSTKNDFYKGVKFSWTGAELGSCVDIQGIS